MKHIFKNSKNTHHNFNLTKNFKIYTFSLTVISIDLEICYTFI